MRYVNYIILYFLPGNLRRRLHRRTVPRRRLEKHRATVKVVDANIILKSPVKRLYYLYLFFYFYALLRYYYYYYFTRRRHSVTGVSSQQSRRNRQKCIIIYERYCPACVFTARL